MTTTAIPTSPFPRGLPPVAAEATIEGVRENLRLGFADLVSKTGWPVYLFGPTGTGKTFAAAVMLAKVPLRTPAGKGIRAAWFSMDQVLRELIAARQDPKNSFVEILTKEGTFRRVEISLAWGVVCDAEFAVFDDVGTRELTPAQTSLFREILDRRKESWKRTVFTGNHNRKKLEEFMDKRIVSRLFSGTAIFMGGEDRRTHDRTVYRVD